MMKTSRNCFGKEGAAKAFFEKRIIRIVPSYWFFTTLMVISTIIFSSELNTGVFTPSHAIMSYLFIPHFNPRIVGLLQPILGLGWTLVYEMFFYVIFAFCLLLSEKAGLLALLIAFVGFFGTARIGVWSEALNTFWGNSIMFDFLLGVLAYKFFEPGQIKLQNIKAIMLVSISIIFAYTAGLFSTERVFYGGVPSLILFTLLWGLPAGAKRRSGYILVWLAALGDASYVLYLSHPFTLVIAKKILLSLHSETLGMSILTISYILVTPVVAIGGAIAYWSMIEAPLTSYLYRVIGEIRHGPKFGSRKA